MTSHRYEYPACRWTRRCSTQGDETEWGGGRSSDSKQFSSAQAQRAFVVLGLRSGWLVLPEGRRTARLAGTAAGRRARRDTAVLPDAQHRPGHSYRSEHGSHRAKSPERREDEAEDDESKRESGSVEICWVQSPNLPFLSPSRLPMGMVPCSFTQAKGTQAKRQVIRTCVHQQHRGPSPGYLCCETVNCCLCCC